MATGIGLIASKEKSQRSIICGLLKVSRKGCDVLFCLYCVRIYHHFVLKAQNKVDNHPRGGGGYSGFQVTGMIEEFLWV